MKLAHLGAAFFLVLGFATCCFLVHFIVGDPLQLYAEQRSEKLTLLARQSPPPCSAAFGSSHVHNGFDPRVFDRTLAVHGIETRSINLAIEGGSQTEQFVMAKRFFAGLPPTSGPDCLIVLEMNAGANFAERHLVHPRAINIYDAQVAGLSLKFAGEGLSLPRRIGRSAFALAATTMHYLNVGMLASRLLPREVNEELLRRQSDEDKRGLLVEQPLPKDLVLVREAFETAPANAHSERGALDPGLTDLVSRLMAASGGRALQYVYLNTPKLTDLVSYAEYPACLRVGDAVVRIVNVALPRRFPALYRQELWNDVGHLNEAGAALFSKLIADEWAAQESVPAASQGCDAPARKPLYAVR